VNLAYGFCASIVYLMVLSCRTKTIENQNSEGIAGRYEVARQLLEAGEYSKTIGMLKTISSDKIQYIPAQMLMGSALLGLGDAVGASIAFKKIIQKDKTHDDAYLSLGYTYIVLKNYEKAKECFNIIIKKGHYPKMENVFTNYGLAFMEAGNCLDAQHYFNKTLQWDPTSVAAHYNNGLCLMKEKKYKSAKYSFQRALDFCPNCLDPALSLAKAKFFYGEKEEAKKSVEQLLRNQMDSSNIKRAKELLLEFRREL